MEPSESDNALASLFPPQQGEEAKTEREGGNESLQSSGGSAKGEDNGVSNGGSEDGMEKLASETDKEIELRLQLEKLAPFPSKDETKSLFPPIITEQDFSKKYYYNAIRSFLPSITPINTTFSSTATASPSASNSNNNTVRASPSPIRASPSPIRASPSPTKSRYTDSRASYASTLPNLRGSPNKTKQANLFIEATLKPPNTRSQEEVDALFSTLRKLKTFESLNNEHKIKELCKVLKFEKLPPNYTLFKQGDVGDAFYIIYKGSVRVQVHEESASSAANNTSTVTNANSSPSNRIILNNLRGNAMSMSSISILTNTTNKGLPNGDHFVTFLKKGDRFGLLLSQFEDVVIRTTTVVTVANTTLIRIEKDDYIRLLKFTIKKECEENLEFLKRFPVFHSVSPSSMSRLSESVTPRSFKVDEVLIDFGTEVDGIYFIQSGKCKVTKTLTYTRKGKEKQSSVIVAEAGVGDMVGELEVFRKVPSRQMQVIATEPTKALFAPLYEFDKRITLSMLEMMKAFVDSRYPADSKLWEIFKERKKEKRWIAYKEKLTKDIVADRQTLKELQKMFHV